MITQVCQYLRNWFERAKYFGDFTITSGDITFGNGSALPVLFGQYYRIVGSVFNDGVHCYPSSPLKDESFNGSVWILAIPKTVIDLSDDIGEWVKANAAVIDSPYQSESFAGYSYNKYAGGGGTNSITWQSQFAARLAPWRKI